MYSVGKKDKLVEIQEIPKCDVGAPCPTIIANENELILMYYLSGDPSEFIAVMNFQGYWQYLFGTPNEDAIGNHPLARLGLRPYRSFEVKNSTWVNNLVNCYFIFFEGRKEYLEKLHHYILPFHDSTFECVAEKYSVNIIKGQIEDIQKQQGEVFKHFLYQESVVYQPGMTLEEIQKLMDQRKTITKL